MDIKVFKKGNFYCEETGSDLTEQEIDDSDVEYIVFDRRGIVGVVTCDCYNQFTHWIDNDSDDRYRVERT